MKTVKITKDDFIVSKWNGEIREYEQSIPEDEYIHCLLSESCEIDTGVTLKDIFSIVERYPSLVSFISKYSSCYHIDDFHKTINDPLIEDKEEDGCNYVIDYLEVYKRWHVSEYKKEISFSINEDFHGIGHYIKDSKDGYSKKGDKTPISVSYSPMNELANYEVKLNHHVEVYKPFNHKKPNSHQERVLIEGQVYFTLLEVLNAIYYDISFMGGPEDNKEFLEELNERVEEIDNGTAKLIPMDEILKEDEDEEFDNDLFNGPYEDN